MASGGAQNEHDTLWPIRPGEPRRWGGGRGRGYICIYILLYRTTAEITESALSRPLQFTSLAKPWGEFEGGGLPRALIYTPLGRANHNQNSLKISVWFLVTFWKISGGILALIFNDFPAHFLIK